jgi:SagB-type dehydrogenase family enzyme
VPLPRRRFLTLALAGVLAPFARRSAAAEKLVGALDAHQASANTLFGALDAGALLSSPPLSYKRYTGFAREGLGAAGLASRPLAEVVPALTPAASFVPESISRDRLSGLLRFTNGVTGQLVGTNPPVYRRAAPSAGALYAGEVYVLAERVLGLAPGLYAYQPLEHALVGLRKGPGLHRISAALESPASVEHAAAVVLLTNVFGRYTWKYGQRGYRYALLDSGHIGENLRLAAAGAGLSVASPLRFHDDALNELLGQDGRREAVCALHAVGIASEWGDTGEPGPRLVEKQQAEALSTGLDRVERYHEGTKLVPLPGEDAEPPPEPEARAAGTPKLALPALELPPERSVTDCIWARRSARRFGPGALALWELGFVLEMAAAPAQAAPELDLLAVVHRVEGVAPGLYRYLPEERGLEQLEARSLAGPLERACLFQDKAASAAVAFLVVGEIEAARVRAGERSYRDLLLQAGALAQRIYLAAEAIDLGARNLAAFFDAPLNALAKLDGRERAVVHLTVLGREA